MLTEKERSARAQIAAFERAAQLGGEAATRAANAALVKQYEDRVDPERTLTPADRLGRARSLMGADLGRRKLAALRAQREGRDPNGQVAS